MRPNIVKKILSRSALIGVALVTIAWLEGMRLPAAHTVSVSRYIVAESVTVFNVIADFENYPHWLTGVKHVRIDSAGPPIRYTVTDSDGAVRHQVMHVQHPSTLQTLIVSDDLPYGGSWFFTIESQPVEGDRNVSLVTIREDGQIYNPAFRFFAHYLFGHTSTADNFLADLSAAIDQP